MILYIILAVVLLIIILIITIANNLKKLEVKINESISGIDVALTKRFDLLTKSLNTVKGYMKYEDETLKDIVSLRNPGNKANLSEKVLFDNQLSDAYSKINVVMENYPQLKANTQFSLLQRNIADSEEHLQAARRLYNSAVSKMNQEIVVFPKSIIASMIGMNKKEFYSVDSSKKEDVSIEF